MVDGTTAALTPSAVSLSATWDVEIVAGIGELLATEVRDKKADILLAPTGLWPIKALTLSLTSTSSPMQAIRLIHSIVCLHRSPLGGRNFESFSGDDPFLGGKLAASYINAVEKRGIATTIKHFAANDQETRRFVVDQMITDRCLRELHLVPFQIAIRDSNPSCVMASYSKMNGVYASNNKRLLTGILRDEWKFDGIVMSDWFGVNSIVPSVEAGLDLEMPGPARKRGKNLVDAVNKGYMKESTLNINVRRVLGLVGLLLPDDIYNPRTYGAPPHLTNVRKKLIVAPNRSIRRESISTLSKKRNLKWRTTDPNTKHSSEKQLRKALSY